MADEDFVLEDEGNVDLTPPPVRNANIRAATLENMKRKTVRILLEENDEIPAVGLYLGHNGNGFLLKPGLPVDVPPEILEILNHAVMSAPIVDPQNQSITGWRERMRYPYRVLPPTDVN